MPLRGLLLGIFIAVLSVPGCTCKPKQDSSNPASDVEKQVNLAIWANYLSEDAIKEFTAKTGIEVQVSNYSSNEELLAKLQAGGDGFDVIVPSDYMVTIMKTLGLLRAIDKARIPNLGEVDPRFLNKPFDPANEVSLPYAWTVTGLAVNRDVFKGAVAGWEDVFKAPELAGKISMLDDSREVLAVALRMAGKSSNSTEAKDLEAAKQKIMSLKKSIKAFTSEPLDSIATGEVAVAQIYSSDALQARKKSGGKVDFLFPSEGGTLAIDNIAIPKGAPHANAAYALVNFLLSQEVSVSRVQNIMSGPILKNTREKLPAEFQQDKTLFPDEFVLSRLDMMQDVGDAATTYDRVWTEVKAF